MSTYGLQNPMSSPGLLPGVALPPDPMGGSAPSQAPADVVEAATQFESMFLDLWLTRMREAGAVFSEGSFLDSPAVQTHQQMLDQQWAITLSEGGGIGIRDVLIRQLTRQGETPVGLRQAPAPDAPNRAPAPLNAQPDRVSDLSKSATIAEQGRREAAFDAPLDFVRSLLPVARAALAATPLNPIAVIAQGALETGWGKAVIHDGNGASSHNLFGIKSHGWEGPSVEITSMEQGFGALVPVRSSFRSYPDWNAALEDYVDFLGSNPRYADALGHGDDPEAFAGALQAAGYATDPAYAGKLARVVDRVLEIAREL